MSKAVVPNAAQAFAAAEKVRDYPLAPHHPDNGGRAAFFARFGFVRDRWRHLQAALIAHPLTNEVTSATAVAGGTRYRVRCNLATPDGRNPCIITIWAVEPGLPPRLITAFPGTSSAR